MDYQKLQNGSDIRGIALEGIQGEEVNLTPVQAKEIARAFVCWLSERTGRPAGELRIAVGRDSRLSGPALEEGVLAGLTCQGASAARCAMASTPAMFMSTVLPGFSFDGSVMITASHLPWNRNGLKFFTADGGLEKGDIAALLALCQEGIPAGEGTGSVVPCELMPAYAAHLREVIRQGINDPEHPDKPLDGFQIAVDAGNGAGGFFPRLVLEPLGADTSASVYLEPDGHFPNHIPNPENKEAMASIRRAVLEGGCDLGIIFDTDVDRAGAVDSTGEELSRNRLIGLMAAIVAEDAPGSVIVTDSVTSAELKTFIEQELGCIHHRFKRGYKNVINEAIRLNEEGKVSLLAMETSGHGALKENYFLDDGAYLSAKIIIKAARLRREGRTLGQLLEQLREPLEARAIRMKIARPDFKAYGAQVLADLEAYAAGQTGWVAAPDNHEGFRASIPGCQGWFLLRMSLHDPLMPLNIESNLAGGVEAIVEQLKPFLQAHEALDLSVLEKKG